MKILPLELSTITSRKNCDTSQDGFEMPIMLAPMSFFTHKAIPLINNRFLYILPRISPYMHSALEYENIQTRISICKEYSSNYNIGCSVGLSDKFEDILELSKYVKYICVDIANGYSINGLELVSKLKEALPNTNIITGNIGNYFGLINCINYGADFVRYGIGSGKNCSTSIQTPIGTNGFDSLMKLHSDLKMLKDVENRNSYYNNSLIYDGGIKSGNDLSFALLYCKWVMSSSMFGGTELNIHHDEIIDKNTFELSELDLGAKKRNTEVLNYGMASRFAKNHGEYIEGFENWIPNANFEDVYKSLKQSLQSSMSYLNSHNLIEYRNSIFEIQ